ncbi:oligoendopeptidase F [Anaerobacillus alkaliphilus]|uniref:Oligopeptidase F n=1 Tax=Anaerobacillus alkaliphilus TaxID=1548597 RepID=A0A4Q0VRT0_9BACI|nr:oligoendopeptidase F [Anaerobacillus alkaliphilus]RXI98695.1 oligoendopeptidase F [Anaerobacillus alkaliphilus]
MAKKTLRSEVPVELTWNLEDLFETEEAWEAELASVQDDLPSVVQFKGRLAEGATVLLDCLNAQEDLHQRVVRVATYSRLRQTEDGTNSGHQGNAARTGAMLATVGAALTFVESEILALPEGTIERYLNEEKGLEVFSKNLHELLEKKPHQLSPETEETLAALGQVLSSPYMTYEVSKSSDMDFPAFTDGEGNELPLTFALFEDRYELSTDTTVRRNAYEAFSKTLNQYKNTFAATYSTEIKKQVVLSRQRKYESVTHMLLQPHQVTLEMYHNQLDIIQKELASHMRRFAQLKKRVLGLDKMMFCDLKAPLDPDFNPSTTYEEASETILKSLEVMGEEYHGVMKKALTERWVDLAENVGKATGAFCSSPYGVHPYILITWTDTMRGAFILTHELGHAGHFYYANGNQRLVNTRPSLYFIEAPSTINELLLSQHLLKTTDDTRMKRWVLLQSLGTYYHNFVTHLLEGELQRRVYTLAEAGKPITALTLSEQKKELLENFWGDSVEIDDAAALTWMRQPHYYMGLYPYTYSAGLTASTAVAELIREEGQPAVDRWIEVLKAGGTMRPLDLLKHAGVDMSTPDPIRKAVAYVGSLVDELEKSYE